MPAFDDDLQAKPIRKPAHEVGQALDALSAHELQERIALLQEEIERLEQAIRARHATQAAAAAFFKS
jgi:uncharacterized small protein (DUF1192 family)